MKKIEKLQANCLTMKSEFNQIYKKESQAIESSELFFQQAAQRKMKEELYKQTINNLKSSFKLSGLDVIMKSINNIKENISIISSSKTVPSQLENSMRVICVAADILKLNSFNNFRSIIKDLYGNQILTQLSNQEAVTPDIRMFFAEQTFSANEITDGINRIAKKVFRGDLKKIEFITGPQSQSPNVPANQNRYNMQPPQTQIPQKTNFQYQPPPSQPSNQNQLPNQQNYMPTNNAVQQPQQQIPQISYPDPGNFKIPTYPKVKEPVFNQEKNHQNVQNQQNAQNNANNFSSVLRNQMQNIPNVGSAGESYHSRIKYEQHPEIYHLIDVPVFPREIWPTLSKIVTNSVA